MDFVTLDIPAAGTWKRDCELIDFQLLPNLCFRFIKDSDQTKWELSFPDYFSLKITSEEFTIHLSEKKVPEKGSFYIIKNSPWILDLNKIKHHSFESARHYLFYFYDEIIEVIAKEFKIKQINYL